MTLPNRFRSTIVAPNPDMTHLAITIRWQNEIYEYLECSPLSNFHDQWSRVNLADKPQIGWCRQTQRWYVDYLSSFTDSQTSKGDHSRHERGSFSTGFEVPEVRITIDDVQFSFRCVEPIDHKPYRPHTHVLAYQSLAVLLLTVLVSELFKTQETDELLSLPVSSPDLSLTLELAASDGSRLGFLNSETVIAPHALRNPVMVDTNIILNDSLFDSADKQVAERARISTRPTRGFPGSLDRLKPDIRSWLLSVTQSGFIDDDKLIEMYLRADRGMVDGQTGKKVMAETIEALGSMAKDLADVPPTQRLGLVKARITQRPGLTYNRDFNRVADILIDGRLNCVSGSIATVITHLLATQSSEGYTPVFVHTSGHVQPGLLKGSTLWLTEATQRGAHTTRIDISQLQDTRVTDARVELAGMLAHTSKSDFFWQSEVAKSLVAYESLTSPAQIEGSAMPTDSYLTMLASHGRAKIPDGDRPLGTHPASSLRRRTTLPTPNTPSSMFAKRSRVQSAVDVHLVSHAQRFTPVPYSLSQAVRQCPPPASNRDRIQLSFRLGPEGWRQQNLRSHSGVQDTVDCLFHSLSSIPLNRSIHTAWVTFDHRNPSLRGIPFEPFRL